MTSFLALLTAVEAQHVTGRARVGYLGSDAAAPPDPFTEGLRALGCIEGHNLVIERLEGRVERAAALAAELVNGIRGEPGTTRREYHGTDER